MLDLLVQLTTSDNLAPADHVLQVMNEAEDDFLCYKPSTPIGENIIWDLRLDTVNQLTGTD
jgi:hypothetical protein